MKKKNATIKVYFEDLDGIRDVRVHTPKIENDRIKAHVSIGGAILVAEYDPHSEQWVVPSGARCIHSRG
jgi:hypothetical protein